MPPDPELFMRFSPLCFPKASSSRARVAAAGLLALTGLGLAGCNTGENFPPPCPALSLLGDAADLTRYNGAGRDVTDTVLSARITAVPAMCKRDGAGRVRTTLNVMADVVRGPAMQGKAVDVPYFIAITENGKILDKMEFVAKVEFPSNVTRVPVVGQEIGFSVAVTPEKSAAAYKIYVGFSLTPDEVATNRKTGG